MAELSKDIAKGLAEFLKTLPDAPRGPTEEALTAIAKQKALHAATHKTRKYAYYIVGPEGGFVGGRKYAAGDVVQLPVDKLPSKTWKAATAAGVAVAEAEVKRKLAKAAEESGSADEDEVLEADELEVSEPDGDEEPEEPEAKPTPPAKPKAKAAAPKKGAAGKAKRASDQDVA